MSEQESTPPAIPAPGSAHTSRRGTEPEPAIGADRGRKPVAQFDPALAALRQRTVLLRVIRVCFVIVLLSVAFLRLYATGQSNDESVQSLGRLWYLTFGLAVALATLFIAIDLLTPTKKIATLVSVAVGLLVGVLATLIIGLVIDLLSQIYTIEPAFLIMFKILLGICLSYFGVTMVLQTQDDVRLLIPYVEFAKQLRGPRPLLLDSSALIDARFADALQTGFFQAPIVIPRFVLTELQQLADSQDKLKRAKGRRALDIVARLQRQSSLDVTIDPTSTPGIGVDQALIELAVRTRGMIITTDSGLARVAGIQGATVLNVNDLATALRPALAAGEHISVKLIKPGEQPGQAVGYLPDGTMIVAEDGEPYLGREAILMVVSTLQTSGGRLVFGRIMPPESGSPDPPAGASIDDLEPADNVELQRDDPESAPLDHDPTAATDLPSPRSTGPFPPRAPARPKNRNRNPRR